MKTQNTKTTDPVLNRISDKMKAMEDALIDAKEQIEYLTHEAIKYRRVKKFVYGTSIVCIDKIDKALSQ